MPRYKKTIAFVGGTLILFILLVAMFADYIAPHSPYSRSGGTFEKPSSEHLLGTNDIGQDILSELIFGTRISLLVGAISAFISVSIGTFVGLLSGWYGGSIDRLFMKITTFFLTIPFLPCVIVLAAFTNGGVIQMSMILGLMSWAAIARVIRTSTMKIRESTYIKLIRGMGASNNYILFRHVIRELLPLVLYRIVTRVKSGILSESSISFLGLGNPTLKSWGSIIYYAQAKNALITGAWIWWIIPPGLCICIVSVCLMMITYSFESKSDARMEAIT